MKSLKKILFDDRVPLPSIVKKRAEEFKKNGEKFIQFFCKIEFNNQIYYYIRYLPSHDGIVIREDGTIPPLSEVSEPRYEDPLWLSRNTDMVTVAIVKTGKKWAKSTTFFHQRVLKLLSNIKDILPKMSPDIEKAYNSFYKTSQIFIEKQRVIKESYLQGKKIDDYLFKTYTITKELNRQLNNFHGAMTRSAYWQNYIQMETYEDRKSFLKYIKAQPKKGLKMWWMIIELNFHHNHMLNRHKVSQSEVEEMEKYYEEATKEGAIKSVRFYEEILPCTRNPK